MPASRAANAGHAFDEQRFRLDAPAERGKCHPQVHPHIRGQLFAFSYVLSLLFPLLENGQLPTQDRLAVVGATESEESHGVGVVSG